VLAVLLLATAVGPALAGPAADTLLFGGSLRIAEPVAGDLIAAGGNVVVEAPVAGDAFVAGGQVRIAGTVGQSLVATGGQVTLDAAIGRHLRVGGGQVEVGAGAEVGGDASIGGGRVVLRGPVRGTVRIGGGQVLIDSAVDGDVIVGSGRLTLGPDARIAGSLRYRSGADLARDPAAQVVGPVELLGMDGMGRWEGGEHGPRWGFLAWFWTVGVMLLAGLVAAAVPATTDRLGQTLGTRPGGSLGRGVLLLLGVPVLAVLLVVTIVGIPLALAVLLLYPVLLFAGYLATALGLGQWALTRVRADAAAGTGARVAAAMAAVLLLALAGRLPVVGGAVALLAVLVGMGAIALLLFGGPRRPA
jgi:hypothetical protein